MDGWIQKCMSNERLEDPLAHGLILRCGWGGSVGPIVQAPYQ